LVLTVKAPRLLGVIALLPLAAAAAEPRALIERMNRALAERNYDGVFIHQLGKRRETLRIIHRVENGQMTERLVSTDGTGREMIRKGQVWTAYYPDRRVVVVEKRSRSGFITGLRGLDQETEGLYEISGGEPERVQGHATQRIEVRPRDGLRYGYRLWIDEKTAMPVRSQLLRGDASVIQDITFISLTMPKRIDDELLQPDVDASEFRWLRRDHPAVDAAFIRDAQEKLQGLPQGFRVRSLPSAEDNSRSRLVLSDGLAWVSVFIEPANAPARIGRDGRPREVTEGLAQIGASAAYTVKGPASNR
jgi:sigma-E factor negative regulatory protein RseB